VRRIELMRRTPGTLDKTAAKLSIGIVIASVLAQMET
jgi:hypothetical protein